MTKGSQERGGIRFYYDSNKSVLVLEVMGAKRCLNLNKLIFPSFSHFGNTCGFVCCCFLLGNAKEGMFENPRLKTTKKRVLLNESIWEFIQFREVKRRAREKHFTLTLGNNKDNKLRC